MARIGVVKAIYFWRAFGYAVGALLAGVVADLVGSVASIHVEAVTLLSGIVVAGVM